MSELKVMVDAGHASAGAPLGPALGPTGVNIGEVVAKINEKTASLVGMKVPVTIKINSNKTFDIEVGLPPISALIKKESKAAKGAANPKTDVMGNLTINQVVEIAKTKYDKLNAVSMKNCAKIVIGTCNSMGVTIEGMHAKEAQKAVDSGKWDAELKD
ncbi:MAG: 50S ribosomal protein L11 [Candidatus ainarchaeum sp.]|jgi:large subunit ribosomal protein L11|nr:50S ribosomal protein L11 [Candidatus ainarchaeum sp.]MDD3085819.1 50S ribosomal protein L11 [Candidatus ainarchaeum sp.]MDD4128590.1 50S ribosomal protein L11 [Candidatus ainarchaeum sp.]MDD4467613.1 50S ribosomal protein L11 [Candidatus ainarchaeum sp.]